MLKHDIIRARKLMRVLGLSSISELSNLIHINITNPNEHLYLPFISDDVLEDIKRFT